MCGYGVDVVWVWYVGVVCRCHVWVWYMGGCGRWVCGCFLQYVGVMCSVWMVVCGYGVGVVCGCERHVCEWCVSIMQVWCVPCVWYMLFTSNISKVSSL